MKKRSVFLTKDQSLALRGIAILMVILSHYADWYADIWPSGQLHYGLTRLGVYGVDLFFLVSGYGLVKSAAKNGDARHFWKGRIKNTWFPYLVIAGGIGLCAGTLKSFGSLYRLLTGYDFWFIRNILIFYLLFFLVFRGAKRRWLRALLFASGVWGYSWWLAEVGRGSFWFVSNISFVIGVLLALYEKELLPVASLAYPAQIAFLTVLMIFMAKNGIDVRFTPMENCDKMIRGSAASGIWTLLCAQTAYLLSGGFVFLKASGKLSLELYLLHQAVYQLAARICGVENRFLQGGMALLLTAAGAWAVHRLLEKFWELTKGLQERRKVRICRKGCGEEPRTCQNERKDGNGYEEKG